MGDSPGLAHALRPADAASAADGSWTFDDRSILASIVESSADALVATDLELRIRMINQAGVALVGADSADEVIGRSVLDWMDPDELERALQDNSTMLEAGTVRGLTYSVVRPDGTRVTVEVSGSVILDAAGEPLGFLSVCRDVTDRIVAEETMKQALLAEAEVIRRLEEVDDLKNTFLRAVSHELRTPLTAILGLSATLSRGDVPLTQGEQRELAGRIEVNAERLEGLLRDLLDFQRLEHGVVDLRRFPCDVGELIHRVVGEIEAGSRDLIVDATSTIAEVDPGKIERIIENLLRNAIAHTPPATTIWVRARPEREGVLIVVEDSGPGVPEDLRETIFEPFHRSDDEGSPGLGIGLSLVRRFAEMHGGLAWVQERIGGGAAFMVWFPRMAPSRETDDIIRL